MMTKNVNERREALQYYLLGCKVPADEGDPAGKKRKVTREKLRTRQPRNPNHPILMVNSFMYSFLGKYICAII
jgi:hypothetical protein